MVAYRRRQVPGGTFFFTITLDDRGSDLLLRHVDLLRAVVAEVQRLQPFVIVAAAVLPEHLHMIWRLPQGDADHPGRWRAIKAGFTRRAPCAASPWQRRHWEHIIRNRHDLERHVDYIHYNPVKHGLVERAADWRYSSIHRYIRSGERVPEWTVDPVVLASGGFGEPLLAPRCSPAAGCPG